MRVRYLKGYGPYAAGDVREAGTDEAYILLAHGIAEPVGGASAAEPARAEAVHTATAKGAGRRTAAVRNDQRG